MTPVVLAVLVNEDCLSMQVMDVLVDEHDLIQEIILRDGIRVVEMFWDEIEQIFHKHYMTMNDYERCEEILQRETGFERGGDRLIDIPWYEVSYA